MLISFSRSFFFSHVLSLSLPTSDLLEKRAASGKFQFSSADFSTSIKQDSRVRTDSNIDMTSSKKLVLDDNAFARLETFLANVEVKLASMKGFYEKFYELITLVAQTHGTIFQELTTIKVLLTQSKLEAQAQHEQ